MQIRQDIGICSFGSMVLFTPSVGSAGTLATGLASETILQILRQILAGASLKEVLTSVARVLESHRDGMLCSV